jgi:hypothetical protein
VSDNYYERKGAGRDRKKRNYPVGGEKKCPLCEKNKPLSEYPKNNNYCSSCKKDYDRKIKTSRRWNISIDTINDMYSHGCAVCGKTEGRMCIDHDHACCPGQGSCGKCVRGVLCTKCNAALGMVDDSIERLQALIAYLEIQKF